MGLINFFRGAAEPQQPVFMHNVDSCRMPRGARVEGGVLGAPQATEWYTQERLIADGMVGLYKTGRRDAKIVAPGP